MPSPAPQPAPRSSPEEIQRAFKTLADPTRARVLSLLVREELAVQELMDVLEMAQSRISGHLRILREAGLVADRRQGSFSFYRYTEPSAGPWRDCWRLLGASLADDPACRRDAELLASVLVRRATRTRAFFDAVGSDWDGMRTIFNDDALRARAVCRLARPTRPVVEVGAGTGTLSLELARLGFAVYAVDHSDQMLDALRNKASEAGLRGVTPIQADASSLPLADGVCDAAFAHMVLRYLSQPARVLAELARVTRPGGEVVLVDFVRHDLEWMRQELGVQWLGFEPAQVEAWFRDAGLSQPRVQVDRTESRGRDLPATFIASATRLDSTHSELRAS